MLQDKGAKLEGHWILILIREMLLEKFALDHVPNQIETESCGQGNRVLPAPVK